MEDSCAMRYPGSCRSNFNCPIGVVQAILRIFRLRPETKRQPANGEIIRFHRITDPLQLHHFLPRESEETLESQFKTGFRRPQKWQRRCSCDQLSVEKGAMQIIRRRN